MTIENKVVVITGASSGIGEATAELLAEKGAKLVLIARREERLKAISEKHPTEEVIYKAADVSKYEEVEQVIKMAMDKFGRIDALFNNAGVMPTGPLVEGRREEWKYMLDVNIMGVLNGIAATLPIMVKQQSGHVITTSSVAGHVVYPNSAVYCGTKFAVRAIMEGLRQEHRLDNIQSTIISPGNVATELYTTINDEALRAADYNYRFEVDSPSPVDIASAVVYAIDTADNVSVSEMIIRPTKQQI